MKFRPPCDYVIVKPKEPPDKTPGGLHIPDMAQRDHVIKATVVSEDWADDSPMFPKGCTVLIYQVSAVRFEFMQTVYYKVKEENIIAAIEEE